MKTDKTMLRKMWMVACLVMMMMLSNCGGGGDQNSSVTGPSNSPTVPTEFAPDSDVGGTYTFIFDNDDGTVFTAYIRSTTTMDASASGITPAGVTIPGRHSYRKTGNNTAYGMFEWGTVITAMDLTFTSATAGRFVVTNYQKGNTGRFTFTLYNSPK